MFYISLFLSMISLRVLTDAQEQVKVYLYRFLLLFLFLFAGFRFQVGCDWSNYLLQYEGYRFSESSILNISSFTEPLYLAILRIVYYFDLSFMWVNAIFAGVFFYGVNKLALRQKDPIVFLIFLFPVLILNMPMSGIRQGAAIGIMCIAFISFMDKKLLNYVLWTIVASGFHLSALIFLALIPFVKSGYTLKKLFLSIMLVLPFAYILYVSVFAETINLRYIESEYDAAGAVYRLGSLLITSIVFFIFFQKSWKIHFPADHGILMLGFLIATACFFLIPFSSTVADRLGYYFIPIQAIFFAKIPFIPNIKMKFIWVIIPYFLVSILFIGWISLSDLYQICYDPYLNYITGVPAIEGIYGN